MLGGVGVADPPWPAGQDCSPASCPAGGAEPRAQVGPPRLGRGAVGAECGGAPETGRGLDSVGSLRIGGLMRRGGGAGSAAEVPGGVTACGFARSGSDPRLVRATGVGLGSGPALWVSDGRRNRSSERGGGWRPGLL